MVLKVRVRAAPSADLLAYGLGDITYDMTRSPMSGNLIAPQMEFGEQWQVIRPETSQDSHA
jgi:hypothetical protein